MAAASLDEETTAKVLRQIEYYLGDASLPGDSFLLEKISENEDGLVDLALLCTFQKMRTIMGLKETDPANYPADKLAAVAQVLRESTSLKLSEDGKRVGRVHELPDPEVFKAEVDARSIAANPFPNKMGMEKVEALFKPHAKINYVRLPWHKNSKIPSGFAVIEFSTKEEALKVLKTELTCEGVKLELETKAAFDARKETLLANDKGNDKSKKLEKQSQKPEYIEEEIKKGVIVPFTAKKIEATETKPADETEKAEGENEEEAQLSREHLKEGLAKFGTIKYVDYAKGKESGYLRFADPEEVQKLREASKEGVTIANHLVTFQALEGEAEEEYLKKVKEGQGQRKRDFAGGRGFGGGRGRGGGRRGGKGGRGGRGRGHKRPSDGEGPKDKAQKTEQT